MIPAFSGGLSASSAARNPATSRSEFDESVVHMVREANDPVEGVLAFERHGPLLGVA
jgi:hypothetical protein